MSHRSGRRWLKVPSTVQEPLPPGLDDSQDVRYSEELVAAFVEELTEPGDLVLDPFAGFGTTLLAAAAAGRRAIGVELLPERASYIRSRVGPDVEVHAADARDIGALGLADVDLVMTSPPYMTRNDHRENPLSGYRSLDGDYDRYLAELRNVFGQVRDALAPSGHVVVDVANLRHNGVTTTLAWDVASALSEVLTFEREVVVVDEQLPWWVVQEYCLVFRR